MWPFYHAGMYLLMLGIHISSIWNYKSRQWLHGRKNWKRELKTWAKKENTRIWFHVSSLGEFEQARPVIEKIKRQKEEVEIILSFFSPSGFLVKYDYPLAKVIYLPPDLPGNAEFFIDNIQPDMAVFTKYDLWPGYLNELLEKKIPTLLISADWDPNRKMTSWSLPITQKLLKQLNKIFLQREDHVQFYRDQGYSNITVAGDTRIDRSLNLPNETAIRLPHIIMDMGKFDLVAGSTWPEDEAVILEAIEKLKLNAIIAPHDVSAPNIERLTKSINVPYQLLSGLEDDHLQGKVLIIDSIGLLSVLYSLGDIAYVGGGFGKSIHNILEPAAHAKPIIFGPHYHKFTEAKDLISLGAAWSVKSDDEFQQLLLSLMNDEKFKSAGKKAFEYLADHSGATQIVTTYIFDNLPDRITE